MYSREDNLLFIHIPKTGGQTIVKHFLERDGLNWSMRKRLYCENINFLDEEIWTAHLTYKMYMHYDIITHKEMKSLTKFSIVRNPYDRFISFFNMIRKKHKEYSMTEHVENCKRWFEEKQEHFKPYLCTKPQSQFIDGSEWIKIFKYENYGDVEEFLKPYGIDKIKVRNTANPELKSDYAKNLDLCTDFVNTYLSVDFKELGYEKR
jgi:hypothetical protein